MKLPYSSYTCNRSTFEDFLEVDGEMIAVVANPMHHTNSTVRLATKWFWLLPFWNMSPYGIYMRREKDRHNGLLPFNSLLRHPFASLADPLTVPGLCAERVSAVPARR